MHQNEPEPQAKDQDSQYVESGVFVEHKNKKTREFTLVHSLSWLTGLAVGLEVSASYPYLRGYKPQDAMVIRWFPRFLPLDNSAKIKLCSDYTDI
jgi:hypothetical protein